MNVWRLITHHAEQDRALAWIRSSRHIAFGWRRSETLESKATDPQRKLALPFAGSILEIVVQAVVVVSAAPMSSQTKHLIQHGLEPNRDLN